MSNSSVNHDSHDPAHGPSLTDLPPVEAPSAGFIVQLFVIPAVIVAVVIVVWLLFGKLAGGERDAMEYVQLLRSPNGTRRAAFELASLIQNDPELRAARGFSGESERPAGARFWIRPTEPGAYAMSRSRFNFQTLDAQSRDDWKVDPLAVLARSGSDAASAGADRCRHQPRQTGRAMDGRLDDAGAVRALGTASEAEDPTLRQVAAFALGFFGGQPAVAILRDRLNDPDCFVRDNAAKMRSAAAAIRRSPTSFARCSRRLT